MNLDEITHLFELRDKTALVTGGAVGIGKAIARRLAQAGARVMITDINETAAQAAAEEIRAEGGAVEAIKADAGNRDDVHTATQTTVARYGGLDILVNNAGIFPSKPVMEITPELWRKVIDVNLNGAFFHAQEAARVMIDRGSGGRIVNIVSVDALHPSGNLVHYDSSKAGMLMMTRSMAAELGKHRILVNAVAPGAIQTPGASAGSTVTEMTPEQFESMIQAFIARIPLGHMGQPDDIANAVLFLASRAADYVTGALLVVDGGYLLS